MALSPATRLGPYEIVSMLGSGGMGEVYRARDTRLSRTVALKVLHADVAANAERRARFQREARAASSLNHPHICTLHDVGTQDGLDFLVMEYVDGRSLADRLADGPLEARETMLLGAQIADALHAAHREGIVHRDLKPANVMLTRSGVKLLDFGLARLRRDEPADSEDTTYTRQDANLTAEGVVLGTVPYMAPEQLEGRTADARTDIFALGAVLYEMATGRRAFHGDSRASLMASILKDDPPPVSALQPLSPPALDRVIRTCLAKHPDDRWQNAGDLARELRWMAEAPDAAAGPGAGRAGRRVTPAALALGAVLLAVGAAGWWLVERGLLRIGPAPSPPRFQQATFRTGNVSAARFAPDGQGIVYTASWEGAPHELFLMRRGGSEARPLGLTGARILAISADGEMALLRGADAGGVGVLARAPLSGGAPRDVAEGVVDADWMPDGKELAVLRRGAGHALIEFPLGWKVYEAALLYFMRVSPDGRRVVVFDLSAGKHEVAVLDRAGTKTTLSTGWAMGGIGGLAWSPRGDEVVFAATRGEVPPTLHAVSLDGRLRTLTGTPKHLALDDVFRDGRALVRTGLGRGGMACATREGGERELGWLDYPQVADVSPDGSLVLFTESRAGGGPAGSVYLRKTDGSPAVRLGEGRAHALSVDGRWVLASKISAPQFMLLPTGPGAVRELPPLAADRLGPADWLPDGRGIVFSARRGPVVQVYVQDVETGALRAVLPEGVDLVSHSVSPDGRFVLGFATGAAKGVSPGQVALHPLDGGDPRPVPWPASATFLAWSADGSAAFVATGRGTAARVEIDRVDLRTGRPARWTTVGPADPLGIERLAGVTLARDGGACCYSYSRALRELYVVEGLDLRPAR